VDHERGLFRYDDDNWMLVYDGNLLPNPAFKWSAGDTLFHWDGARWSSAGEDVSGTPGRCFTATGSYASILHQPGHLQAANDYVVAVAFDPAWHFQERVAGAWQTLHTINGVYFAIHPPSSLNDPRVLRPVDAHGHVPACYADGQHEPTKK
jgi:hypothetical protein